jgi:hypothetical protein
VPTGDVHVHPVNDLVAHDLVGDSCVCVPRSVPVTRSDGSIGWVIVHHSLDGREQRETDL